MRLLDRSIHCLFSPITTLNVPLLFMVLMYETFLLTSANRQLFQLAIMAGVVYTGHRADHRFVEFLRAIRLCQFYSSGIGFCEVSV